MLHLSNRIKSITEASWTYVGKHGQIMLLEVPNYYQILLMSEIVVKKNNNKKKTIFLILVALKDNK